MEKRYHHPTHPLSSCPPLTALLTQHLYLAREMNAQHFIQSLFHCGHMAMVIQNSTTPFQSTSGNIHFVQSLAADEEWKPLSSSLNLSLEKSRKLRTTEVHLTQGQPVLWEQLLDPGSYTPCLRLYPTKWQGKIVETTTGQKEISTNYTPDKSNKLIPSTQEEL